MTEVLYASDTYEGEAYTNLVEQIEGAFANDSTNQVYGLVPLHGYDGDWKSPWMKSTDLNEVAATVDTILCIGKESVPDPSYDGTNGSGNYMLSAAARSNVETSAHLYQLAIEAQDTSRPEVIVSGWVHNRHLDTFVELPRIARELGVTIQHLSDLSLREVELRADELSLAEARRAAIVTVLRAYPTDTEAEHMKTGLLENEVPAEDIFEEDDSFDTISNILFARDRLERTGARNLAIVANRDHLPRIVWLANYLLPKDVKISFVETDPRLDQQEFLESCERERKSFLAGSGWMEPTGGEPEAVLDLLYNGYLNPATRRSAASTAQNVQSQS